MSDAAPPAPEAEPPKKLSLADLIGDQGDTVQRVGSSRDRPAATTIADAMRDAYPLARELRNVIDWKEQLRAAKPTTEEPRVLRMPATNHMIDPMRETNRRIRASEEAEQRTVAALETMLKEALASK